MAGVLQGVRVIDFGQYIAGPLAAMLLADQGADVIHVDPPGGPRWNTSANAIWNRGKRGIALDLKQPDGLKIARDLIASADVVIENFRPGVMARLGLDAKQLTQEYPHLIWCALPGFASDDPRAAMPAWEGVLGAATGNFALKVQALRDDAGRRRIKVNDTPIYTVTPVSSIYAAFFGAVSIAMALIARQRDGCGQCIEVPLFDATFSAVGSPKWAGIPGTPWTRSYECADGRWVDMVGYHAKFNRAFLKAADVEHWLNEPFIGDIARPFRTEPAQAAALLERMEALFRTRTALEWETVMSAAGVPLAVCRTSAEWLALPQARASQAIIEMNDPVLGPMLQPGVQVRLSETPGEITAPAPLPDQHRVEILAELKRLPSRSATMTVKADRRPPLAGLRVIDLGTVLVGPACGRTLAEFGAEVIKIDDPAGLGPGVDVGRGKRSMLLDLRKPEGREILARLADGCDVFLQNFRMGVAEKMGIGYEQLRERNPGMVYISFTLYGREGPWAARPGYENQAQATTGMMERFGDGPPAMEPFPVSDYGTALMGTYAAALALYHRTKLKRRGEPLRGQHVDTALVYTTSMLQSPVLHDFAGKTRDEPRGQNVLGSSPLHRNYRAQDGWLFLGAKETQIELLDAVPGLRGIAAIRGEGLAVFLEQRLMAAPVAEWMTRCGRAGVGVHKVMTIPEVMADPWVRAKGLYLERNHPDGGIVATIGPIPRLSHTPLQPGRPLRPSMDAKEVLADVQLDWKFDQLLEAGVIAIRSPRSKS